MSQYDDSIRQKPLLVLPRGRVKEYFVIINHDWFVPVQLLRRLNSNHGENEIESIIFPQDESFDSHWQLFIEHQSHPARIRIGLALLAPRDRCIRADIKLIFVTTHGGQIIKENLFHNHTFFLAKGEAISSYINEHISPKVFLDIEDDLYENVINGIQQGNLLNTDDCTIFAYVRFINEFEIEPKTKAFDFSRRFTVDWKLTKFRYIIEQINQSKPPTGSNHRLVSDRFQFTYVKILEGLKTKKWNLLINYPRTSSINKQTPLCLTLKSSNILQPNYGKFEIMCKNENNIFRRYIESIENLTDNYPIEFFTLDELSTNIYKYKQNFNENNGRFIIVDYLLFSIKIIQPLKSSDIPKKVKRISEPTIISLNKTGKVRNKKEEKSSKEQRTKSLITRNKKPKSPVSQENVRTTSRDETRTTNPVFPPIRIQNNSPIRIQNNSPVRIQNNSPVRLRSPSSFKTLPNLGENLTRSFTYKPVRLNRQSSTIPSASTTNSLDKIDNFTFLANLFRSGLHSDITIRYQDHQWNLHKSILSARSIYFNHYFADSKESELILSDNNESLSSTILDKMFLFLYTNQYTSEKNSRLLFQSSIQYGIDTLTLLCLQDMCNQQNLNINTAANLLISLHQAMNGSYEKYHSIDYLNQIKNFKQIILRFIQLHSREVLLSSQWKLLEKHYPYLVHDVLEFVVFEKIDE